MIRAEENGGKLTEMELYNTCLVILGAGHVTTTRLISNGLYLFLSQADTWRTLRENPELVPTAVEEVLRFEPPLQLLPRYAKEDLNFHGHRMKAGNIVVASIAAGNRDPDANVAPEVFDISREKVNQVSFGYGIHHCIGASLARLEAKVAFEKLLQKYPDLSLQDPNPQWGTNPYFRGLDVLEVNKQA